MFSIVLSGLLSTAAQAQIGKALEKIPIQDAGRIKPFDTFARETLQLIYGKSTFEGRSSAEVVFTWMLIPEQWRDIAFIELRHSGLREALKIDSKEIYFSPKALFSNERLPIVVQELQSLRERQEKLNPYFQAVNHLENQLGLFQAVSNGSALRFVPDPAGDKWKSVAELDGDMRESFSKVTQAFVSAIAQDAKSTKPSPELTAAVDEFIAKARALAPEKYADDTHINVELHFNHLKPFQWAWVSYLLGLIFLYLYAQAHMSWARVPWVGFFGLGMFLHAYGMGLRVYLAGRPPVSNMYETVVWVPFVAVVIGCILSRVQKSNLLLVCAGAVATFCLILTNLAPTVLDGSIQPLEPVLRSNFWLTIHVLTITMSYGAFFLAFAIGDVILFCNLKNEAMYAGLIRTGTQSIYRAIQIGVVLVAAGTILGGVWADYSWGRFWGWDPKETWALITLLGYVAVLHGRLVGWIKNFEFAVAAVVTFSLVIMSWYGVNFVLGAGLHSYGFGAGGVEYVALFVVLHLFYAVYATTVRYGRLKN
jgi:cytochrome c-type biogenesis protein CcsB